MLFLNLFQFLTRLLISKLVKHFSTYLVGPNGTMWKTCYSDPQNANNNQLKLKTNCVTDYFLTVRSSSMKDYTCITWWAHKRQTFILISIKKIRILIFCLQLTGYLKTRKTFQIFMFAVMNSGKCDLHIHFPFLQEF